MKEWLDWIANHKILHPEVSLSSRETVVLSKADSGQSSGAWKE